tara:strand:+ start:576 stop:1145 length:570 start_codon:yes stop_codon:yes gene_type:complete
MKDYWYYNTSRVDSKFIDKLVKNCLSKELEDGLVTDGSENPLNEDVRKAKITFLDELKDSSVFNLMNTLGVSINNEAFGFDINQLEALQFTLYDSNNKGKYDWHHDTKWISNNCYHRKMSLVLQLSNPSDYEGGELEIKYANFSVQDKENIMQKGSLIAFPSFWEHRVTPVTKGKRMSLIGWFIGAKFR